MDKRLIPVMLGELSFLEYAVEQTDDERFKAIVTKSAGFLKDILEGKVIITEDEDDETD